MPDAAISLDESGDLGWKFDAPYRKGGSSRYLTIASILYPQAQNKHPKRLVKDLYNKLSRDPKKEIKWADMDASHRTEFASQLKKLVSTHADIKLLSITVKKENVHEHIRKDANKLYNYMIGLSLLDEMKKHSKMIFTPDQRSIKVASGNSLNDYLQTTLWFEKNAQTKLITRSCDSKTSKAIQIADMLAGAVQMHFEDRKSDIWQILKPHITHQPLYFRI